MSSLRTCRGCLTQYYVPALLRPCAAPDVELRVLTSVRLFRVFARHSSSLIQFLTRSVTGSTSLRVDHRPVPHQQCCFCAAYKEPQSLHDARLVLTSAATTVTCVLSSTLSPVISTFAHCTIGSPRRVEYAMAQHGAHMPQQALTSIYGCLHA
eukprot:5219650-Amphidinium_carterae.1